MYRTFVPNLSCPAASGTANSNSRLFHLRRLRPALIAAAIACATGSAMAQSQEIGLWANVVHQQVVEGKRGGAVGNLAAPFEKDNGVKLNWTTIPFDQMQDKVLREINLSNSKTDIVFILNTWAAPGVLAKLVPMNDMMKTTPIQNMADVSPAMVSAFTDKAGIKGIPIRHNPQILHYNKKIFAERGVAGEPQTFEEFLDTVKKTTFKRADGAQVYGFAFETNQAEDLVVMIRAYGGDVLSQDLKIRVAEPAAVKAITALRELYAAGALPPNLGILKPADLQNLMSQGLIAMGIFGDNYYDRFNNKEQSQVAGNTWFAPVPAAKENTAAKYASSSGFWAMGIPANGDPAVREKAYKLIAYLAQPETQLTLALNNNSQIRASVYSSEKYAATVPYAAVVQKVLPIAAPPFPAFPGSKEAERIFLEESVAAITGQKPVKAAMDAAAAGIERVLKREGLR